MFRTLWKNCITGKPMKEGDRIVIDKKSYYIISFPEVGQIMVTMAGDDFLFQNMPNIPCGQIEIKGAR